MSQDMVNGHRDPWKAGIQSWNDTITNWSHHAKDYWKSPRVTVIRIEVLVSALAIFLLLLGMFGSQRRRSRNWLLQKGSFAAYTLSFSVATYTLGSMQSSGVKSSMYPSWAVSLIMLHACTDSITAYSLDDNRQQARLRNQALMYFAYALLLLVTVPTDYTLPLIYMVYIAIIRYIQRVAACWLASYSWNLNKMVADHMYDKQNKVTMEDCNYLVDWPRRKSNSDAQSSSKRPDLDEDEAIDVGKIWQCELGPEVKDTCLSFSLFHLLRRRFFGFACDESKDSALNFVLEVLLAENKDYNRAFKVIEVELAFMYDFFFTKYAVIYYGSMAATVWSLVSAIGISITAYITVRTPVKITQGNAVIASSVTDDIVITLLILASTAFLECLQLFLYWTGIWGRVSFVCQSVRQKKKSTRGSRCMMGLKEFLAKIGLRLASNKHYWQHKLGQYALLDSVSYRSEKFQSALFSQRRLVSLMRFVYLIDRELIHPINDQAWRVSREPGKSVELPDEVKKALICTLKCSRGTLSNGKSSLHVNNVAQDLSWACEWEMHTDSSWSQRKQNQTHIILTWHIATCYCEMAAAISPHGPPEFEAFDIATKLSRYCAYLVVSAPKLLPGHPYDTRRKFDEVADEAVRVLGRERNKYAAMNSLAGPPETIFTKGVKLGKQLEGMAARWKVMADFWAEMMLYVTPSDHVEEHIEQLAQGGEFITHLWALLSHAGILEREERQAGGV